MLVYFDAMRNNNNAYVWACVWGGGGHEEGEGKLEFCAKWQTKLYYGPTILFINTSTSTKKRVNRKKHQPSRG